ncbi:MAG: hypothetical protein IT266_05200 [Saprospiraceae bacterium]|nr:hypothetical protein [Saprospiraceae bacterium]
MTKALNPAAVSKPLALILWFCFLAHAPVHAVMPAFAGIPPDGDHQRLYLDTIRPLANLNFEEGNWKVHLKIASVDKNMLPAAMRKGRYFTSKNKDLLREMQKSWVFVGPGGDMATVESRVWFTKNRKRVLEFGIVIEEELEGIQSPEFGWLTPVRHGQLAATLGKLKRIY